MANKPNIRFKGFTDDWEQRKLGEIAERVQGNDGRMNLPILTISAANGWMSQEDRFSGNIAGKEQGNYTLLHKGELSYNHGNSKLAKYGTVFSLEAYKEALVPRVYHSFKTTGGNSNFIEYYFATKLLDKELAKLISSGARMDGLLNIGFKEFMGINLKLPLYSEQVKIAEYLRNLDHLITLHQRKCDETKKLKKFMLQKMFPKNGEKNPEIRFAGFTDDWEQRKLGEITNKGTKKNTELQYNETFTNSAEFGIISQSDFFDHSVSNPENICGYYIVENNSFVYNPRISNLAPVGPINRNKLGRIGIMSPLYTVFEVKNINVEYLEWFFKSSHWHSFMYFNGDTGARADRFSIKDTLFFEMPIPIPDIDEQAKIGEYFSTLDHLITLHQRKCDKLKLIKKFMLQNMFPKKG